ncbi:MAG: glycine cleavage system protein GcvH [Clostridiales bacterium]|nr:glycine cleavage system protein GcvH [Clostridiales bacterium]
MKIANGLLYSKEHEWIKVDGTRVIVGITDFAQDSLGNIVFVELPVIGTKIGKGETLCVVESVKAASDIYSPVKGRVVEANENLTENPELVNEGPYEAWIAVLEINESLEIKGLMDAISYESYCNEVG